MEGIINELSSPKWWLSVVIAGIFINLLAAYTKPLIDRYMSSIFSWWRNKSEIKKIEREKYIENLKNNKHLQLLESLGELRERIRSVYSLALGIFSIVLVSLYPVPDYFRILILGIAAFCLFLSYLMFHSAAAQNRKINEARISNK